MKYSSLKKNTKTHMYMEFNIKREAPAPVTSNKKYPASYIELILNNILRSGGASNANSSSELEPGNDIKCYPHGTPFAQESGRPDMKCVSSNLQTI